MIKNLAPVLSSITVSIFLRKGKEPNTIIALITPKPLVKSGNDEIDTIHPIVLTGNPEKIEVELNKSSLISKLSEYNQLVSNDEGFIKALERAKENAAKREAKKGNPDEPVAAKPKKGKAGEPKKAAAPDLLSQPAEPEDDKDLKLLALEQKKLTDLIATGSKSAAVKKWTAIRSLCVAIKDKLTAEKKVELKALKEQVEAMEEPVAEENDELDLD